MSFFAFVFTAGRASKRKKNGDGNGDENLRYNTKCFYEFIHLPVNLSA